MRIILLLTIFFLASCENKKEKIVNRQQSILKEMEQVKAAYFKTQDSLESVKEADTSTVLQLAVAKQTVSADSLKSIVLVKLQNEYDSLELEIKKH